MFHHASILDYEFILYLFIAVFDIVVGNVDHSFYLKDSKSKEIKKGIVSKLIEISLIFFMLLMLHTKDLFIGLDVSFLDDSISTALKFLLAYFIYADIISIVSHFKIITGVDLLKDVNNSNLKNEIVHKINNSKKEK